MDNFSQFKKKFVEDAFELIDQFEKDLLDLENSTQDDKLIEAVFRAMHTLKGVSSMYGFSKIAEYTHHLETVFDFVRKGETEVNHVILDVGLASADLLRKMLKDDDSLNIDEEYNKLLNTIAEITNAKNNDNNELQQTSNEEEEKPPKNLQTNSKLKTYYVIFSPDDNLLSRGINVLSIFKDISEIGTFDIVTHKLYKDDGSESINRQVWGVFVITEKSIDAIEDAFIFVLDECRILKLSDTNLFENTGFSGTPDIETIDGIKDETRRIAKSVTNQYIDKIRKEEQEKQEEEHSKEADNQTIKKETTTKKKTESSNTQLNQYNDENIAQLGKQITTRISVDSEKLDKLMYLVSELVTTKAELNLIAETDDFSKFENIVEKIDKLSKQFRDNALSIRLIPLSDMILRLKRLVRDLSKELNKEINFITEGTETELDKNVVDVLAEPLMHILRNSIDHGIETADDRIIAGKPNQGTIMLKAYNSGTNIHITITDDGKGINPEIIRNKAIERDLISPDDVLTNDELLTLIFSPGFSTAGEVTEISGRGVGMDVVKQRIAELRGDIDVESELNKGTTFTIKLQQTISIIDTLLLQVNNIYLLVPLSEVEVCDMDMHENLFKSRNNRLEFNDELVPFIYLRQLFNLEHKNTGKEKIVIIKKQNKRLAFIVDRIIGEHQAVIKPLGKIFYKQNYQSGASILGDGNLALMLNTDKLLMTKNGE